MSTQFDQVFEGLSQNSLTLEDACRVLYSELQASPESMRVCCERIESELSRGRISSDAAQLLLDALGEGSKEDHHKEDHHAEEMWVDVPLEPLEASTVRSSASRSSFSEAVTEVDLTMDDLLAALDHRGPPPATQLLDLHPEFAAELAAPVEWMEWEPEEQSPQEIGSVPSSAAAMAVEPMLAAELDLVAASQAARVQLDFELAPPEPIGDGIDEGSSPESTFPGSTSSESTSPEARAVERRPAGSTALLTRLSGDEADRDGVWVEPPHAAGVALEQLEPIVANRASALQPLASQAEILAEIPIYIDGPAAFDSVAFDDVSAIPAAVALEAESTQASLPPAAIESAEQAGAVHIEAAPRIDSTGTSEGVPTATTPAAEGIESTVAAQVDPAIDEVFAPRVEHVLKESLPMANGVLLKDRYRIVGSLAPGGLGQLFEAIDTQSAGAPQVALKLIEVDWQEEPRAFETLQAIVRHVRRLRHPNILSILDIDRDDKHAIIAMEPLRGCWLSHLVRDVRGRGVGYAVAWSIISGIANGLAYAHQHGAVHSELNPHMVFLSDTGQIKIVGFGLAHAMPMSTEPLPELDGQTLRVYADAYCGTHWILGSTPQGVDDLYPLGAIAYELLTGAHPFNRSSPAVAAGQQLQPLPIPGLDRRIRRVIERCLAFDRKQRPANGASFLAHIEPADQLMDLVRQRF